MLGLTPKEISYLESLKHPTANKVLELLRVINDDPTLRIYATVAKFVDKACNEIDNADGDIITRSTDKNKTFERIITFIKESPVCINVSKQAREILKKDKILESDNSDKKGKSLNELSEEHGLK